VKTAKLAKKAHKAHKAQRVAQTRKDAKAQRVQMPQRAQKAQGGPPKTREGAKAEPDQELAVKVAGAEEAGSRPVEQEREAGDNGDDGGRPPRRVRCASARPPPSAPGVVEQQCRDEEEPHELRSLQGDQRGLPGELYGEFVDRYRQRLLDRLGDHSPYFYTFKRLLFWGRLPPG